MDHYPLKYREMIATDETILLFSDGTFAENVYPICYVIAIRYAAYVTSLRGPLEMDITCKCRSIGIRKKQVRKPFLVEVEST